MKKIILTITISILLIVLVSGNIKNNNNTYKNEFICSPINETELIVEDWMLNYNNFNNSENSLLKIEKENELIVEDWMLNSFN